MMRVSATVMQVSKTRDKLYEYQEELERRHREEEDRLMAQFHQERLVEAENMQKEMEKEWEQLLKALTDQFDSAQKKKDKVCKARDVLIWKFRISAIQFSFQYISIPILCVAHKRTWQ